MAQLEAEVWYWTPARMVRDIMQGVGSGYVTRAEAERLCSEAHRRGFEAGVAKAVEEIRSTPIRPG